MGSPRNSNSPSLAVVAVANSAVFGPRSTFAGHFSDVPAPWAVLWFCLAMAFGFTASATPVDERQALMAARILAQPSGVSYQKMRVKTQVPSAPGAVTVILGDNGEAAGYAVDFEAGGFVLLSANDEMPPVKLHSPVGFYRNLPDAVKEIMRQELMEDLGEVENPASLSWLREKYQAQWQSLLEGKSTFSVISGGGSSKLLETAAWNQWDPYNLYAPKKAPTGCVATQLAILLRYHHLPFKVVTDGSYTDNVGALRGVHAMHDVSLADYDWANLPIEGVDGTQAPVKQRTEVGRLMYQCGVAVSMNYEASESSAGILANGISTYFGYTYSGYYTMSSYSQANWYQMIANDIDAGKPIAYYLLASSAGHAIVCDGYQNGNEIHLNFGWGGAASAWYALDRITLNSLAVSQTAVLGITPPVEHRPQVIPQNTSQIVALGGSANLVVDAYGTPAPALQWRKNGVPISGATQSTLTLHSIGAPEFVPYDVVASNSSGSCTSSPISLVVLPITITTQPQASQAAKGGSFSLFVATESTYMLDYQWYKDGQPIANADAATLTVQTVTASDAGNYHVVLTNPSCNVTSAVAAVTVVDGIVFVNSLSATNVPTGGRLILNSPASGVGYIQYAWYRGGKSLGVYSSILNLANVSATAVGDYWCVAQAMGLSITSSVARVSVGSAPKIATQPLDSKAVQGKTILLRTVATGAAPLRYQWRWNGAGIDGATNASYQLAPAQTNQSGTYSVTVNNDYGSITSRQTVVYVAYPPGLTNVPKSIVADEGGSTNLSVTVAGRTPLTYIWYRNADVVGSDATLTLTNLGLRDKGVYKLVATNLDGKTTSTAIPLVLNEKPRFITQPKNTIVTEKGTLTLAASASGVKPMTYYWINNATNFLGTNAGVLSIKNLQTNLEGIVCVIASNRLGIATSTNLALYVKDPPTLVKGPTNTVGDESGNVVFYLTVEGREPLYYAWFKTGGKECLDTHRAFALTNLVVTNAGSYYCVVTNADGKYTSPSATLTLNQKPRFTVQPKNAIASKNGSLTLAATATGVKPMTYYWVNNETNFLGTNAGSLMLKSIQTNLEGGVFVVASNRLGTATSENFTLYVKNPPVISTPPKGGAGNEGGNFTLTVAADGRKPLNYAWFKTGSAIALGQDSSLCLTNLATNSAGGYFVVITNVDGKAQSAPVSLAIYAKPRFLALPADTNVVKTSNFTLRAKASGAAPMSYLWYANSNFVGVATEVGLPLKNIQTNQAGVYTVMASNAVGVITSEGFTLIVKDPPVITKQPTNTIVKEGSNLVFAVVASGKPGLAYQWKLGAELISFGTNDTLTVTNALAQNAGVYSVTVCNLDGAKDSAKVTATVLLKPVFVVQPATIQATNGQKIVLNAAASGAGIKYQWKRNGTAVPAAISTNLTLIVKAETSGDYCLTASNPGGVVDSAVANVSLGVTATVKTSVEKDIASAVNGFTLQPKSQIGLLGHGVELKLETSPAVPVQWYFNGASISNATTSTLLLTNLLAEQAGSYQALALFGTNYLASEQAQVAVITNAIDWRTVPPGALLGQAEIEEATLLLLFYTPDGVYTLEQQGENGQWQNLGETECLKPLSQLAAPLGYYRLRLNPETATSRQ